MASETIPILLGIAAAALAGWYYNVTLEHATDSRRDQTWWALKYGLVVVGAFAAGRWAGVVINAQSVGLLPETISTYPLVTSAAFLIFGVALIHTLDELLTQD